MNSSLPSQSWSASPSSVISIVPPQTSSLSATTSPFFLSSTQSPGHFLPQHHCMHWRPPRCLRPLASHVETSPLLVLYPSCEGRPSGSSFPLPKLPWCLLRLNEAFSKQCHIHCRAIFSTDSSVGNISSFAAAGHITLHPTLSQSLVEHPLLMQRTISPGKFRCIAWNLSVPAKPTLHGVGSSSDSAA